MCGESNAAILVDSLGARKKNIILKDNEERRKNKNSFFELNYQFNSSHRAITR